LRHVKFSCASGEYHLAFLGFLRHEHSAETTAGRKNDQGGPMLTRRDLLQTAGAGLALTGAGIGAPSARAARINLPSALPEGLRNSAMLDALPGKRPLIKLSYRPPNYETPIEYFRTAITPNDAFFVRYHLSGIPEVDAKTWKLSVGGDGANGQAELT